MKSWEKLALGTLLWAGMCSACHPAAMPRVLRPDTRQLVGVTMDSVVLYRSLAYFRIALPNEAAVCYMGAVVDTTMNGQDVSILRLTVVRPAVQDSSNAYHVWMPIGGAVSACKNPVAIGHSHPLNYGFCTHSDPDARLLFQEHRIWASLVWCPDGTLEVLYQDGRRDKAQWRQ